MKAPAVVRNKSIGTKVSEEEYRQLEAQANGDSLGAWVRQVLLRAAEPSQAEQALMGELVALRTILLNVLFKLANGKPIAPEEMQQLIARADADKGQRARERLAGG